MLIHYYRKKFSKNAILKLCCELPILKEADQRLQRYHSISKVQQWYNNSPVLSRPLILKTARMTQFQVYIFCFPDFCINIRSIPVGAKCMSAPSVSAKCMSAPNVSAKCMSAPSASAPMACHIAHKNCFFLTYVCM